MAEKKNDTIEKVKESVKDFGHKVAAESKKLYSLADLNLKKANIEQENEEEYLKLGELSYKKGGLTGKSADIASKIKNNKSEIKKLDAQIKKLKATEEKK